MPDPDQPSNRPIRPEPHWGSFVAQLERLATHYPAFQNICETVPGAGELTREALLWEVEALERSSDLTSKLDREISQWHESKAWAVSEPLVRDALGTRLQCAYEFSSMLVQKGLHPESSLFSWPKGFDPADVLEWLLTDWWESHGRDYAVERWQADKWDAKFS